MNMNACLKLYWFAKGPMKRGSWEDVSISFAPNVGHKHLITHWTHSKELIFTDKGGWQTALRQRERESRVWRVSLCLCALVCVRVCSQVRRKRWVSYQSHWFLLPAEWMSHLFEAVVSLIRVECCSLASAFCFSVGLTRCLLALQFSLMLTLVLLSFLSLPPAPLPRSLFLRLLVGYLPSAQTWVLFTVQE